MRLTMLRLRCAVRGHHPGQGWREAGDPCPLCGAEIGPLLGEDARVWAALLMLAVPVAVGLGAVFWAAPVMSTQITMLGVVTVTVALGAYAVGSWLMAVNSLVESADPNKVPRQQMEHYRKVGWLVIRSIALAGATLGLTFLLCSMPWDECEIQAWMQDHGLNRWLNVDGDLLNADGGLHCRRR